MDQADPCSVRQIEDGEFSSLLNLQGRKWACLFFHVGMAGIREDSCDHRSGKVPTIVGILRYLGLTAVTDFSYVGQVRRVKCQFIEEFGPSLSRILWRVPSKTSTWNPPKLGL